MNFGYTKENVAKALRELVLLDKPLRIRTWEAYQVISRSSDHGFLENDFKTLDELFEGIRHDQIEEISPDHAKKGAFTIVSMYERILSESLSN